MNRLLSAFWIGFVGDIILQVINYFTSNLKLDYYYETHGRFESMLIAGGTSLVSLQGFLLLGLEETILNLFLYGAILDYVVWRKLNVMSSAKYIYDTLPVYWTSLFGGLSMIITA